MLHLLDTSVCVSLLRRRSSSLDLPDEDCAVSIITAAELEVGVYLSTWPQQQRRAVDALLADVEILPLQVETLPFYGVIRAELQRAGTLIGPLDMLIAAHALSLNASVITMNAGEFRRVKGLKVLPWT